MSCKYCNCNKNNRGKDIENSRISACIYDGSTLSIGTDIDDVCMDISINYCFMCGRKLLGVAK